MNKIEIAKLKAGDIIEVAWDDGSNNLQILLQKPRNRKGDIDLMTIEKGEDGPNRHTVHSQVVKVHGNIFDLIDNFI